MKRLSPIRRRALQSGQTLVSMMVGSVISLITIAALLVVYKTMIQVSGESSRTAARDGQVSAALLAAQMDLQSAGFGVPPGDPLEDTFAIQPDGKEMTWRFKNDLADAGFLCAGLHIEDVLPEPEDEEEGDEEPYDERGLYRLPPKACTTVKDVTWESSEFEPLASSAAFFVPVQADGSAFADGDQEAGGLSLAGGYVFKRQTDKACLPFMQQDFSTEPAAAPKMQVAMVLADDSGARFSACLPNLTVAVDEGPGEGA